MTPHPQFHDIAHLGHLELLTPSLEDSVWFFKLQGPAKAVGSRTLCCVPERYGTKPLPLRGSFGVVCPIP